MENKDWDLVIEAGKTEKHYWLDLWNYRELAFFLSWRDVIIRYKQAIMGIAWAVLRPFLTMIVFTLIFGKVAKLPTEENAPYAIMVFSALLPWQFFSQSFGAASESFITNSNLLTKVYFPRVIVPMTSIGVAFIDFVVSFLILIGMMFFYNHWSGWQIFLLPMFLFIAAMISFGSGLFVASLNVKYRDFRYVVPFVIQFGLYISPVGFSSAVIPDKWKILYSLNPIVGVIDGFRWCIIGGNNRFPVQGTFISFIIALLLMFFGIWYFRKTEKSFADNI